MKFNIKALALTCAILWGAAVLLVALVNLRCGAYGQHFLEMLASCYPGYHAARSIPQVVIGTLYAVADFGWLYNWLAKIAWFSSAPEK